MNMQLSGRMSGYINRKLVVLAAVFALIVQPLAVMATSATAGAVANGPLNVETVCEGGKAVLKLQAKQEVTNWITGNVHYTTAFNQTWQSLPANDVDVWSAATNQVEVPAGSASARIIGTYISGWVFVFPIIKGYDQTFSVNYAPLNCDIEKPTIVVNTPNGAVNPGTISATATDNNRLAQVTAHMYDAANVVLKKNCSQNVAALQVASHTVTCPTTGLADGMYTIRANAKDTAGNLSTTLSTTKFIVDNAAPTASFTYSNNNGNTVTKDDVTVTMKTSEPIQTPAGWTKVNDTEFTKVHTDNGKFSVEIADLGTHTATVKYEVKRIDKTAPTIDGIIDGEIYKADVSFTTTDQNLSKIQVNGSDVAFNKVSGWTYEPQQAITGNGSYTVTVIDKAGNQTTVSFSIDSTVTITVDTIDGATATPTISGSAIWNADNTPVANTAVEVEVNGATYLTMTNGAGEWNITTAPLANGNYDYTVTIGSGQQVGSLTVAVPAGQNNGSTAVITSNLITNSPSSFFVPVNAGANTSFAQPQNNDETSEPSILGAETSNPTAKDAAVAGTSTEKSSIWDLWWLIALIIAAILAFIAWFVRRKKAEQEA